MPQITISSTMAALLFLIQQNWQIQLMSRTAPSMGANKKPAHVLFLKEKVPKKWKQNIRLFYESGGGETFFLGSFGMGINCELRSILFFFFFWNFFHSRGLHRISALDCVSEDDCNLWSSAVSLSSISLHRGPVFSQLSTPPPSKSSSYSQ